MIEIGLGSLVRPAEKSEKRSCKALGVVIDLGRLQDGKTHHVFWTDDEGFFKSWHYVDSMEPFNTCKTEDF